MTTGKKFIRLNKWDGIGISTHAIERLNEYVVSDFDEEEAMGIFYDSEYIDIDEVLRLGYRPRYDGRKKRGTESWYFKAMVYKREILIVITEDRLSNDGLWVTTFGPSDQTFMLRGIR